MTVPCGELEPLSEPDSMMRARFLEHRCRGMNFGMVLVDTCHFCVSKLCCVRLDTGFLEAGYGNWQMEASGCLGPVYIPAT